MDPRLKDERSTCRRAGKQSVYGLKKKEKKKDVKLQQQHQHEQRWI